MPKLLNINSYHYRRGGADVVYLDHAALMESLGWESAFFAMHYPDNLPTTWSRYFVDEIQYGHSYSLLQKAVMATKVVYSFEAQTKINRLVDDFGPDIAHTHCIFHHLSPSILPALRSRGIPVVMTAHEFKANCPAHLMRNSKGPCERCKDGTVLNVLFHRCIKNALLPSAVVAVESLVHRWLDIYRRNVNQVLAPSRFCLEKYVEWGWPRSQLTYVPNYVDSDLFRPDYTPGDYYLYFGRLSPEKGIDTLIRAVQGAKVPLRIVGTGPEEQALARLASELDIDVKFLGYKSGEELHSIIRASRAVVLPSVCFENAPMSVLESLALGKPVIGADIGGIPEMISVGESGWVFDSGNVEMLRDVLEQVKLCSDDKIAQMGRSARRIVERDFCRSRYVREVQAVYSDLGVGI